MVDLPEGIRFAVDTDGVAVITLDRPEVKNAFTFEIIEMWADLLRGIATDDTVRAVVLTGAGDAFCSGVDLAALDGLPEEPLQRKYMLSQRIHQIARAVEQLDKPLIAAVNGPAFGAGLDMALMCDVRFASEGARFSESYISVGLVPGDGGCYYLPRLVGPAKALELLMSGMVIDAPEALRIGMVNRVLPRDSLMEETLSFAGALASSSPIPLSMIKRAVYSAGRTDLATSLDLISSHMAVVMSTQDYREARSARAERRPAVFSGS